MADKEHKHCAVCQEAIDIISKKCTSHEQRELHMVEIAWDAQTVEEKLQDLRKRVERLEEGLPTY